MVFMLFRMITPTVEIHHYNQIDISIHVKDYTFERLQPTLFNLRTGRSTLGRVFSVTFPFLLNTRAGLDLGSEPKLNT